MQATLDSSEKGESCDGTFAHAFGHPSLLEDAHHMRERPDDGVITNLDDRSCGGNAVAQHGFEPERPSVNREPIEHVPQLHGIGSGIDQAAQCHVPRYTREAVKPSDAPTTAPGRRDALARLSGAFVASAGHRSNLAAAHAAPKPLSIPTTVIPAAQEACMASSAVTPSREAP